MNSWYEWRALPLCYKGKVTKKSRILLYQAVQFFHMNGTANNRNLPLLIELSLQIWHMGVKLLTNQDGPWSLHYRGIYFEIGTYQFPSAVCQRSSKYSKYISSNSFIDTHANHSWFHIVWPFGTNGKYSWAANILTRYPSRHFLDLVRITDVLEEAPCQYLMVIQCDHEVSILLTYTILQILRAPAAVDSSSSRYLKVSKVWAELLWFKFHYILDNILD